MTQGVADSANHRRTNGVYILEPALRDGLGGADNIGCANPPVIGKGMINRAIKTLGEIVKYRNIKIGIGHVILPR